MDNDARSVSPAAPSTDRGETAEGFAHYLGTRRIVAVFAGGALGIAWSHALAAVFGTAFELDLAPLAWTITFVGLALGGGSGVALGRRLASRMLPWVDEKAHIRRGRSLFGLAFGLLALAQLARLATWMTDPSTDWYLTTHNPFWADHECLPAYVYGAELALSGDENVYAAQHYPALDSKAEPHTTLHGMTVEDPYQYPPQFLLAPALAIGLTQHYPLIRVVWFAIQVSLLLWIPFGLARWIGGRVGRYALLLSPVLVSAFPTLHALQYGQFHLTAALFSVAAMLLFHGRRNVAGGALLSIAILAKIFPGVFLLTLAAQRRFGALAWTAAFGAGLSVAAVGVLGTAPFEAFLTYHLPRLGSGSAFAFGDAWPEIEELVIADNQGVYGLLVKLRTLGAGFLTDAIAADLNRLYGLLVCALAVLVARRLESSDRPRQAAVWVGLIGLASLVSTGAFGDYVPLTAVWLGTLLLAHEDRPGWLLPALAMQYTLLGTTPLGEFFDARLMIPLSALAVLALLAIFSSPIRALLGRGGSTARDSKPRHASMATTDRLESPRPA